MINESKFVEILTALLAKSRANNVIWRDIASSSGPRFQVAFSPDLRITVSYQPSTSAPDTVKATLNIAGKHLTTIEAEESTTVRPSPNYILIKCLVDDAERSLYHLDDAVKTIQESLASELPTGIAEEQESEPTTRSSALSRITGPWHLDFGKGEENLRIDSDGKYFIKTPKEETHTFTLEDFQFEPFVNRVSFKKVHTGVAPGHPKGEIHSTEKLTVSPDGHTMIGTDSPYQCRLKYTRTD